MININDLNLTLDIINNILIFNRDDEIVYIGDDLRKILFQNKKKIDHRFVNNFTSPAEKKIWEQTIRKVREERTARSISPRKFKHTFSLFPAGEKGSQNLILSTRDKILATSKIEKDLVERVKELECLYNISHEIEISGDLNDAIQKAVDHLTTGFQFPEITAVQISVNGKIFGEPDCQEMIRQQTFMEEKIIVNKQQRGSVRVCYREDRPFLKEERELIKEISIMFSKAIEKQELTNELQKHLNNLEDLVAIKTSELKVSQKRYQDLFKNAPDGIAISDLDGNIIKANPAFYDHIRLSGTEESPLNYITDQIIENGEKIWPEVIRKLKKQKFLGSMEMNLLNQSKELFPVIVSFKKFSRDNETFIEAVFKDIQFKKDLETQLIDEKNRFEKLVIERTKDLEKGKIILERKNKKLLELTDECHKSRKELQTFFSAITDNIVVIDKDYSIIMSNKEHLTKGEKCHKKLFGTDTRCHNCPAPKVFQEGRSVTAETTVDDQYYTMNAFPIISQDDDVERVLETCRNTTKEKQMKTQLLQSYKLASLGKLVAGVAHEINNPNTFIRGNIKIIDEAFGDIFNLLDQNVPDTSSLTIARLKYNMFRENIPILMGDMLSGSNRIKKIVDGLRNFAKKDEGLLEDDVDINDLISNNLRLVSKQVQKHARIELHLDKEVPKFKGNIQKLEQVLMNLLINASQSMGNAPGRIRIHTAYDRNNHTVRISVIDNGKGIDEKTKKYIFDPFFTTKRHRGGTGLGLSISYGIIKEHKGKIHVESTPGEGTSFIIHIPIRQGNHNDKNTGNR